MADIVGLITNVERAHSDLQQLRTKMASVTGEKSIQPGGSVIASNSVKLEAIKQQVGPTVAAPVESGDGSTTSINAQYVQSELRRARETLDRYS